MVARFFYNPQYTHTVIMEEDKRKKLFERYDNRIRLLAASLKERKEKVKYIVTSEILLFVAACAVAVAYFSGYVPVQVFVPVFCTAAAFFAGIKVYDRRNSSSIARIESLIGVYRDNVLYLNGDYSHFGNGERYADASHQYSYDLDIFGRESLYNRMCRTVTSGGADTLARILSSAATECSSVGTLRRREAAIAELNADDGERDNVNWREEFLSLSHGGKIDTKAMLNAVSVARWIEYPMAATSHGWLYAARCSMVVFAVLLLLTVFTALSADFVCLWAVLQLALSIGLSARAIKAIGKSVDRISISAKDFAALLRHISKLDCSEEDNRDIVGTLFGENDALSALAELEAILSSLDRRANVLGLVVFNAVGWSDFMLVRRYLRWQNDNAESFGKWVDAVGRLDAMVSMATMQYNEPDSVLPELVDDSETVYEAKGIYHPFLGSKAVRNDFSIADRNYYIITGANMAGKSTFLRSIGINYILAMCGMKVFAVSMRVSVFNVFSSMRTTDDLAHGISYFNAELLRLRQLIDCVRSNRRTLIILDEILKGTNSLDKLNGSRMFLEAIAKLPVSGIIATHDLELSKMADEHPERFHNFCFEIRLAADITYTYRITPGVAKNQNATYLLQDILRQI